MDIDRQETISSITELAQLHKETGNKIPWAVKNAREAGATWEQISQALGISKQTAWERFAPNSPKRHIPDDATASR